LLQHEIAQLSNEIYSQQKDISNLTIEINNTKKRVIELENDIDTNLSKDDQKPPHY
jgi:uncharacterized coiled-coil protein SlyX